MLLNLLSMSFFINLSRIHELDEETCLEHFETVRIGIQMILEEKLAVYERNKRNEEAKEKVAELYAKVKS